MKRARPSTDEMDATISMMMTAMGGMMTAMDGATEAFDVITASVKELEERLSVVEHVVLHGSRLQ